MDFKPGVVYGKQLQELYNYANENNFALPAVNVTSTSTVNAVLETAANLKRPVILRSQGWHECGLRRQGD